MIVPNDSTKGKGNDAPSIFYPAMYEDVEGKLPLLVLEETKSSHKREGDSRCSRDSLSPIRSTITALCNFSRRHGASNPKSIIMA